MLQSSNHYLRPDYIAAPTAMDTKSSPLALLAQTCSAIGADTNNPKLLAANIEKSTKAAAGGLHKSNSDVNLRDKASPVGSHTSSVSTGSVEHQQIKSSFKPYESNNNNNNYARDRLEAEVERAASIGQQQQQQQQTQSRVKTPKSSSQTNGGGVGLQRCDSNQSAGSQRDSPAVNANAGSQRRTPIGSSSSGGIVTAHIDLSTQRSSPQMTAHNAKESPLHSSNGGNSGPSPAQSSPSASSRLQAASEAAYQAAAKEANYVKAIHAAAAAAAAGIPTSSASSSSASYYPSHPYAAGASPYPMDLMAASALMSPHHPMFKAAALNPYLNYARLKGMDPSIAAAMMSQAPNVCRDPYCTGCPSSPHFLNKAAGQPCPAGCPQCEGPSGKSSSSSSAAAAAVAASSYHAQLAALAAASQLPYVCSWIGSDTSYCGKRFGTSDELFQHLRTHTASMPDAVLSAAAAGGIPPNHPLFQRTYPTPPLSPMSAARYHPYGKPTSMLPPSLAAPPTSAALAGLPMAPHPALAQYFSPYSLYGPRMGSSHP